MNEQDALVELLAGLIKTERTRTETSFAELRKEIAAVRPSGDLAVKIDALSLSIDDAFMAIDTVMVKKMSALSASIERGLKTTVNESLEETKALQDKINNIQEGIQQQQDDASKDLEDALEQAKTDLSLKLVERSETFEAGINKNVDVSLDETKSLQDKITDLKNQIETKQGEAGKELDDALEEANKSLESNLETLSKSLEEGIKESVDTGLEEIKLLQGKLCELRDELSEEARVVESRESPKSWDPDKEMYRRGEYIIWEAGLLQALRDTNQNPALLKDWVIRTSGTVSAWAAPDSDNPRVINLGIKTTGHTETVSSIKLPGHVGKWQTGEIYRYGDIVAWNGSSWFCKCETEEEPGESDHYFLLAKVGAKGSRGEKGEAGIGVAGKDGEQGKRGFKGSDGVGIVSIQQVNDKIKITTSDGVKKLFALPDFGDDGVINGIPVKRFRGDYSVNESYSKGDMVRDGVALYLSGEDDNTALTTDFDKWHLLLVSPLAGAVGGAGTVGPAGPQGPAGVDGANGTALTDAEVKTKYEANTDTNVFTDSEKTELASALQNGDGVSELANDLDYVRSDSTETGSGTIINMVSLTQAAYDALTPVSTTLYVII